MKKFAALFVITIYLMTNIGLSLVHHVCQSMNQSEVKLYRSASHDNLCLVTAPQPTVENSCCGTMTTKIIPQNTCHITTTETNNRIPTAELSANCCSLDIQFLQIDPQVLTGTDKNISPEATGNSPTIHTPAANPAGLYSLTVLATSHLAPPSHLTPLRI